MNQNHEIKIGRRSLRNKSSNDPAPPSTQKTNENELNIQNNPDNNQNNQINPKIEINQELSPAEPSNSVISSENRNTLNNVEIQNPTISNNIVNNNNVFNNNANQFQPVPVQMNPMMKEQMMIEQMTISPINYLMNMNKTTDQIVMDNPPISFNLMMSDMEKKTNADARPIFYE